MALPVSKNLKIKPSRFKIPCKHGKINLTRTNKKESQLEKDKIIHLKKLINQAEKGKFKNEITRNKTTDKRIRPLYIESRVQCLTKLGKISFKKLQRCGIDHNRSLFKRKL